MVDSTLFVSPETPRPLQPPSQPAHVGHSKPLASTCASRTVTSPQQHQNRSQDWRSGHLRMNDSRRRTPAHRDRTDPPDELSPDCDPRHPQRSSTQSSQPRQPPRCLPLTWLEEEKKWVVGEIYVPPTPRYQHDTSPSRSPISPVSPMSPCHDMIRRLDEHIAYNNRLEREALSQPSGSHRFASARGAALNDRVARWVAMTQMHQDQEWV